MKEPIINDINIEMQFIFKNKETTQRIYESLILESNYDPNERAKTDFEIKNKILVVNISAKDSISARATSNSVLKWINLSTQLLSYVNENKKIQDNN